MADEKDPEVERLRRLMAAMHIQKPSRLKRIMARLSTRKIENGSKSKNNKDAA
jgi:hypothetical protein